MAELHPEYLANDFTNYKVAMRPDYERAQHLDFIDLALMEVCRYIETGSGIKNLIIEAPPRHGKSLSVSELFTTWLLGRNPHLRIILASFSKTLAEMNSRNAMTLVADPLFGQIFPNATPDDRLQRVEEWGMVGADGRRGGFLAVGFGSAVTGKGANLLIVDDPHASRKEAESPQIRETVWVQYVNDLLSRANDENLAQIVIAQRYHLDDLIGRLEERQPNQWARIKLPAIAEPDDILGRAVGTALWPSKFSIKALLQKQALDPYSFASQYQQNPVVKESLLFNRAAVQIVDTVPPLKGRMVRFYDLAITTRKRSDYTVGLKMGITIDEQLVVLDVFRDKLKSPDLLEATVRIAQRDSRAVSIVLEGERSGISQMDYLLRDERLRGYTMELLSVEGDKDSRAAAVATRANTGNLLLLRGPWNEDFLSELEMFPAGKHDDQIDALAGAYRYLAESELPTFEVVNVSAAQQPQRARDGDFISAF